MATINVQWHQDIRDTHGFGLRRALARCLLGSRLLRSANDTRRGKKWNRKWTNDRRITFVDPRLHSLRVRSFRSLARHHVLALGPCREFHYVAQCRGSNEGGAKGDATLPRMPLSTVATRSTLTSWQHVAAIVPKNFPRNGSYRSNKHLPVYHMLCTTVHDMATSNIVEWINGWRDMRKFCRVGPSWFSLFVAYVFPLIWNADSCLNRTIGRLLFIDFREAIGGNKWTRRTIQNLTISFNYRFSLLLEEIEGHLR